ncbi:MAG: Organic hydroperoxide resistance transcriptional regulator, partial [uncultured Actinomycetospora sp.]
DDGHLGVHDARRAAVLRAARRLACDRGVLPARTRAPGTDLQPVRGAAGALGAGARDDGPSVPRTAPRQRHPLPPPAASRGARARRAAPPPGGRAHGRGGLHRRGRRAAGSGAGRPAPRPGRDGPRAGRPRAHAQRAAVPGRPPAHGRRERGHRRGVVAREV